jgi:hypothetical protein
MAYTPPNVFVSGTTITGATLSGNNTALREYINVGIVGSDIPGVSVTTIDITRGEFVGVVPDHQFTTGDMYTQFTDLLRTTEKYFTAHIKPYDLLGDSPYQIIADSGKRIVLEQAADVIYSVAYLGVGNPNPELAPQRNRNPGFVGHTAGDVLRTSDIDLCTKGHCFTEDAVAVVAAPLTPDADDSGNVTTSGTTPNQFGLYCRRWYCQRMAYSALPAGVHHFYVAMNPRCDKGHIKVLSSQVEVFYRLIRSQ